MAEGPSKKKSRNHYQTKYNLVWAEDHPIRAVAGDPYKYYCIPCCKKLSCDHQGLHDVTNHCNTKTHKDEVKKSKTQPSLDSFMKKKRQTLTKKF